MLELPSRSDEGITLGLSCTEKKKIHSQCLENSKRVLDRHKRQPDHLRKSALTLKMHEQKKRKQQEREQSH